MLSVLIMSTATGKDIHVESMDAEVTAAIRKDSKMIRKEWKQNMYEAQNHGS